MKKDNKQADYLSDKATFREYLGIFRNIRIPWLFIILIFAASLGTTVAALSVTYFTGDAVDAQGNVPAAQLVSFALGYLVMAACTAGSSIFSGVASERINLGLRKALWSRMIYTRQSSYDADGGESLVSRVTSDCDYASKLLTVFVSFCSVAVSLVIYVVQMYALNVQMANYMLLLIPISLLIGWGYSRLKYLIARKTQAMLAHTTAYLVERTGNLSFIKTANAQDIEVQKGEAYFQEQYWMQIKTGLMTAFYTALQTLYTIISIVIPFAVGAILVANGVMTAGNVVVFYSISASVGTYFTNIIDEVGTLRQANGALARVIRTMKLPIEDVEAGLPLDDPDADLTFESVQFRYLQEPVLQNLTCRIPKNRVTAIIGVNGSGKTTMFRLLERLYQPEQGRILFGETDAEAYQLHAWRKAFCTVAQDSPLLTGTIRENICYGCERPISEDELVRVAKLVRIYDFVMQLPDGFDTRVSVGGQNFSGGQRQCIAIARAIMNSPDYLLLDEATSNLDTRSERQVMDALEELMKGRTTIIIAHSLSAIRHADHVIVLNHGRVESSGTPAEILNRTDNYLTTVMNRRQRGEA